MKNAILIFKINIHYTFKTMHVQLSFIATDVLKNAFYVSGFNTEKYNLFCIFFQFLPFLIVLVDAWYFFRVETCLEVLDNQ